MWGLWLQSSQLWRICTQTKQFKRPRHTVSGFMSTMSLKHSCFSFQMNLISLILESSIINNSWTKMINSFLSCDVQVYTRFHIIQSDPGAEVGDCGGLSVFVRAECIIAISHAGSVCRDPSPTQLGAWALHHRLPHYEVWFLIFDHLIAKKVYITRTHRIL